MDKYTGKNGCTYEIKEVHKNSISVGDTILCTDGLIRTVCGNNITYSNFTGKCIFGDSYQLGYLPVKKVLIKRAVQKIINGVSTIVYVDANSYNH